MITNLSQILKVIDDRIHHQSMHNEEGKEYILNELKILKLIMKDRLK